MSATATDLITYYAQHTDADPTRRSYAIGDQAAADVVTMARNARTVAVDIETMGLGAQAFKVKVIIIATKIRSCVLDAREPRHRDAARDAMAAARELVFQNSAFDVPPLVTAGIMRLGDIAKVTDTLIYSRMAFTGEMDRHGLGDLEKKFLARSLRTMTKDNLAEWGKANRLTKAKVFEVAQYDDPVYAMYAGWDGVLTAMVLDPVRDAARRQLTNHPFGRYGADPVQAEHLMEREQRVNRIMLRRSAVGIRIDDDRVAAEQDQLRIRMNELSGELAGFGVAEATNRNQLTAALDRDGAFGEDYPRTKTGKYSTAKGILDAVDHPAVTAFRAYDDHRRLFAYLEDARLVAARTDGRIHPQVNILKARTGRMSYSNPALQQFTPGARRALMADEHDGMTSIDWSSIEPVLMANFAGDTGLIKAYESGQKFYDVVSQLAGVSYKRAKVIVLAKMYGQGLRSLAAGLGIELDEAKALDVQVSAAMPMTDRLTKWAAVWSEETDKTWTLSGRIIDVDPEFGYKGTNFVAQGSNYDVLAETLVAMEDAEIADRIYLAVHDELVVSSEIADETAEIMRKPPDRLIEIAGRTPIIRVDRAELGERWDEA